MGIRMRTKMDSEAGDREKARKTDAPVERPAQIT